MIRVDKYCTRLFFFVLIFTPLAFGTVEPWSYAVMESAVFAALFLFFFHAVKTQSPVYQVPGLVWLGLLLFFILLQAVPMPPALVGLISPASFEIQQQAAFARGDGAWMTLSVHPRATVQAFFRYAAYAAFYVLAVQLLTRKALLKKTVFVVTVFGALLAFSSILQLYLTEDMALWVRHVPVNSMIVGPYVCHNHYAGLMEMIFPVVLALFFFYRPRLGNGSVVKDLLEIFGRQKGNIHILIGAAALLIASSIFLSLSRGGIISTCLAFFLFAYLLSKRRISRGGTPLTVLVVILVCLSVSWFGWDMIFERFAELQNAQGRVDNTRLDYWRDTGEIIGDYTAAGAGFGTFADIYRPYQSIGENHFVDHAHNDYLELAAEGGVIGLVLVLGFMAAVFHKIFRAYVRRRDPYAVYICIGSVTGIIALLFHSFSDFNLQIGANGLWFFFLLALAVSAAHTRLQMAGDATLLKSKSFSASTGRAVAAGVGGVLVLTAAFNVSAVLGSFYYGHIKEHNIRTDMPAADLEKFARVAGLAAMFDPFNARYDFARADAAWLLDERRRAESAFLAAISKNPVKSVYYKRYGLFLAQAGRRQEALHVLERSVAHGPVNPDNALEYGALLVSVGRRAEGIEMLKKAVQLDDAVMDAVLATLSTQGISPEQAAEAVPDQPGAVIRYAGFLADMGKTGKAAAQYRRALDLMEQGRSFQRGHVYNVYRFFNRHGQTRQAMDVLERAASLLPEDARIRILLGDLYRDQGIFYKAEEKYEAALVIDPDNQGVKNRLERLSR